MPVSHTKESIRKACGKRDKEIAAVRQHLAKGSSVSAKNKHMRNIKDR